MKVSHWCNGLVSTTVLNAKNDEVERKIPDVSGFATTAVLDTKFGEVENKIPDHAKYITTPKFNKFAFSIFDTKLKQVNLATIVMLMLFHNVLAKIKRK